MSGYKSHTDEPQPSQGYKKIRDERYLDWVRTQRCCICNYPDAEPHHLYNGKYTRRSNDHNVANLCRSCHNYMHRSPKKEREIRGELYEKGRELREEYLAGRPV